MLKIISAGFNASIQDLGRIGFASIGVPVSGVMDQYATQLANHLLQNNKNDAVLEIPFATCKFLFEKESFVCITGADFSAKINNNQIQLQTVIKVNKGDLLSFGKRKYGVRTYLAISGGFQSEIKLKSRSFYTGITQDSILKKGMNLLYRKNNTLKTKSHSILKIQEKHFNVKELLCYEGPEYYLLSKSQKQELLSSQFTISDKNNRMGYQLQETIQNNLKSILTSAVLPGTVQLTPSGKLIVLMRDCAVTGGYPRVLQLSDTAINQLAQKQTRGKLFFKIIFIQ